MLVALLVVAVFFAVAQGDEAIGDLLYRTASLKLPELKKQWDAVVKVAIPHAILRPRQAVSPLRDVEHVTQTGKDWFLYKERKAEPLDVPHIDGQNNLLTVGLLMLLNNGAIESSELFDATVNELQLYKYVKTPYKSLDLPKEIIVELRARYCFLKMGIILDSPNGLMPDGKTPCYEIRFNKRTISPYDLYLISLLLADCCIVFERCMFVSKSMLMMTDGGGQSSFFTTENSFNDWHQVKRALSFSCLRSVHFDGCVFPIYPEIPTSHSGLASYINDKYDNNVQQCINNAHSTPKREREVNQFLSINSILTYIESFFSQVIKRVLQTCPGIVQFSNLNTAFDMHFLVHACHCSSWTMRHLQFTQVHFEFLYYFELFSSILVYPRPTVKTLSFIECVSIDGPNVKSRLFSSECVDEHTHRTFQFCRTIFPNARVVFSDKDFREAYKNTEFPLIHTLIIQ